MTTISGTNFTEEQLEADRKADNVSVGDRTGSERLNWIGYVYHSDKKQYDKALAWYLLAARENDSTAYNNIGTLYYNGNGVPENNLCAMKWQLKAVEQCEYEYTPNSIGKFFENGYGVPLDKYKALEWYCHGEDKTRRDRLKSEGYHRSATDKKKPRQQLIKETEAIVKVEKKKLEQKQDKTQQEMEALVDLNITYKLTGGGKDAWNDVPILFIDDKQRYTESMNSSATHNEDEILELKKQIQLLKQERSTFENQAKQLQSLKQEESNLQLQIKERDRQLTLLRNDFQLMQHKNIAFQNQIKTNDSKMASLQRENQELKLKTNSIEQQAREKDSKINVLENEQHGHHITSIQQTQILNSLKQNKQTMEQDKTNTTNEMERLKSSYSILEQLLKSKQDTIVSLNRENQTLSTANQGNQQGANEMVDTLKSLLQSKNNEIELNNLKTENALDKEKGKIKKLQKEIKRLKQHQQAVNSRETRPSSSTTVPETTNSNTGINEDDPNNDFSYDTECGTEYSSSDDTSSEDGDRVNDLNYDSDV